jgi:hypothetical protein
MTMPKLGTRLVTRNRLFALDGAIFLPVGLIMLVAPSPEATMVTPAVPGSLPPLKDTRRLLASQFVTVGLLMLACAHAADRAAVRNLVCRVRALSVFVLLGVTLSQLLGGTWKRGPYTLIVSRFVLLGLLYAYLGFINPEHDVPAEPHT